MTVGKVRAEVEAIAGAKVFAHESVVGLQECFDLPAQDEHELFMVVCDESHMSNYKVADFLMEKCSHNDSLDNFILSLL